MKTIYISMPTKKFEDQSVIGGKRTLLNKKAVSKFQIFGVNISSFCAKKKHEGMFKKPFQDKKIHLSHHLKMRYQNLPFSSDTSDLSYYPVVLKEC